MFRNFLWIKMLFFEAVHAIIGQMRSRGRGGEGQTLPPGKERLTALTGINIIINRK